MRRQIIIGVVIALGGLTLTLLVAGQGGSLKKWQRGKGWGWVWDRQTKLARSTR
jgi:hypothetical protein